MLGVTNPNVESATTVDHEVRAVQLKHRDAGNGGRFLLMGNSEQSYEVADGPYCLLHPLKDSEGSKSSGQ